MALFKKSQSALADSGIVVSSKKVTKFSFFKNFTFNIGLFTAFILIIAVDVFLYTEKTLNRVELKENEKEIVQINTKIEEIKGVFDKISTIDVVKVDKNNAVKNIEFLASLGLENYKYAYDDKERSFLVNFKGLTIDKINEIIDLGKKAGVLNNKKTTESLTTNLDGSFNFNIYFK